VATVKRTRREWVGGVGGLVLCIAGLVGGLFLVASQPYGATTSTTTWAEFGVCIAAFIGGAVLADYYDLIR
jgi:hypothetical protein